MDFLQFPGAKRPRRIVACRRLDADDPAGRRERTGGDAAARKEAAAAAGDEQEVERADLLEELARCRALAGDDVEMIVRGNDGESAFERDAPSDRFAVVLSIDRKG